MTTDLSGKVALVTGGARGLGEAICHCLAESGATVAVADVQGRPAKDVAIAIEDRGGTAFPVQVDVSDEAQALDAVRSVHSQSGRLDVLVNNAGVDVTLSIEELSVADWDRIVGVNLRGPFLLSKAALPLMKEAEAGHIVNIASTAAKRTWANAAAYHASKWGLVGFTHALHVEARPDNVKVTALIAGGMRTPFLLERFPDIDVDTLQDVRGVAEAVRFVLLQPDRTVIPEIMVIPMKETSWP